MKRYLAEAEAQGQADEEDDEEAESAENSDSDQRGAKGKKRSKPDVPVRCANIHAFVKPRHTCGSTSEDPVIASADSQSPRQGIGRMLDLKNCPQQLVMGEVQPCSAFEGLATFCSSLIGPSPQ